MLGQGLGVEPCKHRCDVGEIPCEVNRALAAARCEREVGGLEQRILITAAQAEQRQNARVVKFGDGLVGGFQHRHVTAEVLGARCKGGRPEFFPPCLRSSECLVDPILPFACQVADLPRRGAVDTEQRALPFGTRGEVHIPCEAGGFPRDFGARACDLQRASLFVFRLEKQRVRNAAFGNAGAQSDSGPHLQDIGRNLGHAPCIALALAVSAATRKKEAEGQFAPRLGQIFHPPTNHHSRLAWQQRGLAGKFPIIPLANPFDLVGAPTDFHLGRQLAEQTVADHGLPRRFAAGTEGRENRVLDRAEIGLGLDRSFVVRESWHRGRNTAATLHPGGGELVKRVRRHDRFAVSFERFFRNRLF